MKNERIIQSFRKIEPSKEAEERIFSKIFERTNGGVMDLKEGNLMKETRNLRAMKWAAPVAACLVIGIFIVGAISSGVLMGGSSEDSAAYHAENAGGSATSGGSGYFEGADGGSYDMAISQEQAESGSIFPGAATDSDDWSAMGGAAGSIESETAYDRPEIGLTPPINEESNAAPDDFEKKIVREAEVDMRVDDVREAYAEILAYARELGGYEFSQRTSTREDHVTLNAQIKIPAGKLDSLLEFIADSGEVLNSRTTSDDVTDQYFDTQIRLETKTRTLEQYYKLLEGASSIDDILKIQRVIDQLTIEIESLTGRLNVWESQVAESTVALRIHQTDDPLAIRQDIDWNALSFSDMGQIMRNGLIGVLNFFASVFQWVVIAIVVSSPFLLVGGGITLLILLLRRRRKKYDK